MKLIIGLGNPGEEYQNTRHNIGFMVLDALAKRQEAGDLPTGQAGKKQVHFKLEPKLNAEVLKTRFLDKSVILAKPQTFVNKSNEAVSKLKTFYKVKLEDIIIIRDELDIEFGATKLSLGKGSGGHRGMESIIKALKTENIWQLKIGVANNQLKKARISDKVPTRKASRGSSILHPNQNLGKIGTKKESVGNFVLSPLTPAEQAEFKKVLKEALEKLENAMY